jgi:L-2-amino-thiazoline-4-carboxylic acid hydrolase
MFVMASPNSERYTLQELDFEIEAQLTLGATFTVRPAAVTAAAYETILALPTSAQDATRTVHDIAWAVYQKIGGAAWAISGALSTDSTQRLRLATVAFRTFPFNGPFCEWEDIPSPVGFDCLHCPVADYFKADNLSELCVRTWCALDFPLAETVWDARLERSGSIAGGATRCDFRWHTTR